MRWLAVLLVLGGTLCAGCCASRASSAKPVTCYVGPNMRASMAEIAQLYQQRTGKAVTIESDEARALIDKIEATRTGDLFVTHDPFLALLMRRGIGVSSVCVPASIWPVIAVPKGNPKNIRTLEDLARPGLRVGLTEATNSISGYIITHMLKQAGVLEKVEANVVKRTLVGRDVAKAMIAGEVDACIIWNAVVFGVQDKVDAVEIPAKYRPTGADAVVNSPTLGRLELDYVRVTIAVLDHSKAPDDARAFARFAASPAGQAVFMRNGFSPPDPKR